MRIKKSTLRRLIKEEVRTVLNERTQLQEDIQSSKFLQKATWYQIKTGRYDWKQHRKKLPGIKTHANARCKIHHSTKVPDPGTEEQYYANVERMINKFCARISQLRKEVLESYTHGVHRHAWVKLVGEKVYDKEIAKQIKFLIHNVQIIYRDLTGKKYAARGVRPAAMYAKPGGKRNPGRGAERIHHHRIIVGSLGDSIRSIEHEIAHMIDNHFGVGMLTAIQTPALKQLVDRGKLEICDLEEWHAMSPSEIRSKLFSFRGGHRARGTDNLWITKEEVKKICDRQKRYPGDQSGLRCYLNCDDIAKTTNILNSIVKVDQQKKQQALAERQKNSK